METIYKVKTWKMDSFNSYLLALALAINVFSLDFSFVLIVK